MREKVFDLVGGVIGVSFMVLLLATIPAWFTHLYTCFSDERWGFLIAGAIMFPIAVVHGVGIWFGAW